MENIGPCPLCGGEAERSEAFETWITCLNCGFKEWEHQWQKVVTLAASERRMREALERVKTLARTHQCLQLKGGDADDETIPFKIEIMCDEALKGGEG